MHPEHRPPKILLAEDDGDDRTFFQEFLGDRTDLVLLPMVTNGAQVLDYLDAPPAPDAYPDIIVLDHNMPKLTGQETLQALKATEAHAAIPVVIYSTYVGQQLTQDCLAHGAALVLAKPDSPEGYNQMMDDILGVCRA